MTLLGEREGECRLGLKCCNSIHESTDQSSFVCHEGLLSKDYSMQPQIVRCENSQLIDKASL